MLVRVGRNDAKKKEESLPLRLVGPVSGARSVGGAVIVVVVKECTSKVAAGFRELVWEGFWGCAFQLCSAAVWKLTNILF